MIINELDGDLTSGLIGFDDLGTIRIKSSAVVTANGDGGGTIAI